MVFVTNVFMGERFEAREEMREVLYEECENTPDGIFEVAGFVHDELDEAMKVKELPSLQSLGEMYDFKPYFLRDEKLHLKIDWEDFVKEGLFKDMARFDEIGENNEGATILRKSCRRIVEAPLFVGIGGGLELVVSKRIVHYFSDNEFVDHMFFSLDWAPRSGGNWNRCVGEFNFIRRVNPKNEEWDMVHRKIGSIYRGRGVGTGLLRIMEDFLRQRAEVAGVPQVLSARVGQLDVLLWLLKKGYEPFTDLDREKVALALSGDDSLVIKTDLEEGRDWYVFQKEILEKKAEREQGIDFLRDCLRMTLRKSF